MLTAAGFVCTSSTQDWAYQHPALGKREEIFPFSENSDSGSVGIGYVGLTIPDSSLSIKKQLMVTREGDHVTTGKESRC